MKIAILSTFYPYRGGIAQFNARLYKEFEKEHEVKAFTFTRQYPSLLFPGKTQYVENDDNTEVIDAERVLDSINPISFFKTIKAIRAFKPEVLLLRFWHPFFAPSLGTVAKFLKKDTKVISLLDNVIPHEDKLFYRPFINYFLKQSHGFVVMSHTVRDELLKLKPNAKFVLKQHPLYNHFGEKKNRDESLEYYNLSVKKKTLLFFGFIRDYKGLDILIKAFGQLDESYQLIIAGESYTDFSKYRELIEQNVNKEQILLLNKYIADEEVARLFSCADVCVQPYRSATQSGITAVSYHFDVPMIVTNVGGLKEDIKHEETGLIVEDKTPNAIAKAISYYFTNEKKEAYIKGIKILKKELSWASFCNSFYKFVLEL